MQLQPNLLYKSILKVYYSVLSLFKSLRVRPAAQLTCLHLHELSAGEDDDFLPGT